MRKVLIAALTAIGSLGFLNLAIGGEKTAFNLDANPGPYAVGLKIVEQYDRSKTYRYPSDELGRKFAGERGRPLQTLIWYPAKPSEAKRMTVEDYLGLWASETTFGHATLPERAEEWRRAMEASLAQPLWAVRDAVQVSGRFPVVIYSPGGSDMSWDNADLCEYLASFGYVVVASPSLGLHHRTMSLDLAGANAQAEDIGFLMNYVRTLQNADSRAVAVIGDSWGGLAGFLAAARDRRISALVALDGSMRYYPGIVRQATDVQPERMTIPLLYFMQGDYRLETWEREVDPTLRDGLNIFDAWTHGDLIIAHLLGMAHASLCSMWQRNDDYWQEYGTGTAQPGDYDRSDAVTGYAWMARYTLRFLDAYLKQDVAAQAFIKRSPAENGVPRHTLTVSFRQGSGTPHSYEDFLAEVGRRGFTDIVQAYWTFKADDPHFRLEEIAMEDWAEDLINGGHSLEAISVLKLDVEVHSDSSRAQMKIGNAYRLLGDNLRAIASYEEALKKNPANEVAKKYLRDLSPECLNRASLIGGRSCGS